MTTNLVTTSSISHWVSLKVVICPDSLGVISEALENQLKRMDATQNAATNENPQQHVRRGRNNGDLRNSPPVEEMDELQTRTRFAVGCVFFAYLLLVMFIVHLITSRMELSPSGETENIVNIETLYKPLHDNGVHGKDKWMDTYSEEKLKKRRRGYENAYDERSGIQQRSKAKIHKDEKATRIYWQNHAPFSIEYFYFPPAGAPLTKSQTPLKANGVISTLAYHRHKYVIKIAQGEDGDSKVRGHSASFIKGRKDELVRIYFNESHGFQLQIGINEKYAKKRGDYHHKVTAVREAREREREARRLERYNKEAEIQRRQSEREFVESKKSKNQAEVQQCSNGDPVIRDMRIPSHHHDLKGWSSFWRLVWDWSIVMQGCVMVGAITLVLCMYKIFKLTFDISYLDAAHFGDLNAIKGYIKGRRNESLEMRPFNINNMNRDQHTALHLAVRSGFLDIVEVLCQHGADCATIVAKDGRTPLHSACDKMHANIFDPTIS